MSSSYQSRLILLISGGLPSRLAGLNRSWRPRSNSRKPSRRSRFLLPQPSLV